MKVEVIALKGFGVTKKGGRVRLPRDHAKFMVQTGYAEYPPKPKELTAEVKQETLTLPQKGRYARRDMVAVESKQTYPSATYRED
jgi:hypothetical protein